MRHEPTPDRITYGAHVRGVPLIAHRDYGKGTAFIAYGSAQAVFEGSDEKDAEDVNDLVEAIGSLRWSLQEALQGSSHGFTATMSLRPRAWVRADLERLALFAVHGLRTAQFSQTIVTGENARSDGVDRLVTEFDYATDLADRALHEMR